MRELNDKINLKKVRKIKLDQNALMIRQNNYIQL